MSGNKEGYDDDSNNRQLRLTELLNGDVIVQNIHYQRR